MTKALKKTAPAGSRVSSQKRRGLGQKSLHAIALRFDGSGRLLIFDHGPIPHHLRLNRHSETPVDSIETRLHEFKAIQIG